MIPQRDPTSRRAGVRPAASRLLLVDTHHPGQRAPGPRKISVAVPTVMDVEEGPPVTTADDWRVPGAPVLPSPVLSDADVTRLLDHATRLAARVAGVTAAAVSEADHRSLGDVTGARHTAQWWAHRSRMTRAEAARGARL